MRSMIALLLLALAVQSLCYQVDYMDKTKDWFQASRECNSNKQSPINFDLKQMERQPVCSTDVEFDVEFNDEKIETFNDDTGLTIQLEGHWSTLRFKDEKGERLEYKAYQLHTHLESEHTFNDQQRPLEMHIVYHLNEEDEHKTHLSVAVLGITFQISREAPRSPFLDQWGFSYQSFDKPVGINIHKELDRFVNSKGASVYYYEGSYTTPPCSETVQWFVLADPIIINEKQLSNLKQYIAIHYKTMPGTNARPVQPLNGRTINKIFTTCSKDTLSNDVMRGGDFSYLLLLYCLIGLFIFIFSFVADIRHLKGTDAFESKKNDAHVHFGIFDFVLCHPAFICLHYNPKASRTFRSLSYLSQIAFLFGVAANLNFWQTFLICIGAKPFLLFFRRVFSYQSNYRFVSFLFFAGVITISIGACVYGIYVRSTFDDWGQDILYAWIIDACGIDVIFLIIDIVCFQYWTSHKDAINFERWCDVEELYEYYSVKHATHHHHPPHDPQQPYKQVEMHENPNQQDHQQQDNHIHQKEENKQPDHHHPPQQHQQQQQPQQEINIGNQNQEQKENIYYDQQQYNPNIRPEVINQQGQGGSQIKPQEKHLDTYEVDADEAPQDDEKPKLNQYSNINQVSK